MAKDPIPAHPSGETMKAVCFSSFGTETSNLTVKENVPKPFLSAPNHVLIKVHAASLNPIDKIRLSGGLSTLMPEAYDTSIIGYDVAGIVEDVGDSVTKFARGDHVYVRLSNEVMKYGALAEYVVDVQDAIGKKPSNISFSEAAAVPLAGLTALQSLKRGGVTKGSRVFVAGGAGGVGSFAIQMAKTMLGASYVCTTASPGAGTELCLKLGADRVIDYRSEDFATVLQGENFDMAFDTTNEGGRMGGLLKEGGKIISISGNPSTECLKEAMGSVPIMVRIIMFLIRNRAAERAAQSKGGTWEYLFMKSNGSELDDIGNHLQSGAIQVTIDTEAPSMEEFHQAADKLWSGRSKGKCVIKTV